MSTAQSRPANAAAQPAPASAPDEAHHEAVESAAHLAEAARLLGGDPALSAFFTAFVRYASPEDLIHYTGAELAVLAKLVYARSRKREPGETLLDIFSPSREEPAFSRNETILLAVNDDMPFLYDSAIAEVRAQGVRIRAAFHPIVPTSRDAHGERTASGDGASESVIVLALDAALDDAAIAGLTAGLKRVFGQVHLAVRDWKPMMARLAETIAGLKANPPQVPADDLQEALEFLGWLGDNHFTFLGARDYAFHPNDNDGNGTLPGLWESGLGVLSDSEMRVVRRGADRTSLTPEVRDFLMQPAPLVITKANVRSSVHRRVHMDYVGVKTFDAQGQLNGERRFVGLFTSNAYSEMPAAIPLLRRKAEHVLASSGLPANSHDGKALAHILDVYPRDELFQIAEDELLATALGVLNLGERPKVRAFVRFDRFDRFVSALVFVPRERYNSAVREKIHALLAETFDGRMSASYPMLDDEALARVLYIVGRNPGQRPEADIRVIENKINAAIRTWEDSFAEALTATRGEAEAARLARRYSGAFPAGYRDMFAPDAAVADIEKIEAVIAGRAAGGTLELHVDGADPADKHLLRLKLFVKGGFLPLSDCLPVFEDLGLKVITEDGFEIALRDETDPDGKRGVASAVHSFRMMRLSSAPIGIERLKPLLEDAFHAVWAGQAESDGFNKLVASAGMAWRDVAILRAVAKFLRQTGFSLSQSYVETALSKNPDIAKSIVELFRTLHDPDAFTDKESRRTAAEAVSQKISAALTDVPNADDDRILRTMEAIVAAMLRTNFFQPGGDGQPRRFISFKLASRTLDIIPAPRPLYEIFVYSPDVEGVHLRFGKVARGGIRWSDRPEDFRTEILSLVKAQQVKNAVIVPVGAKGGFYPKRMPANATREEVQKIGISTYKTFIGALLDLTDNIEPDGAIVPPKHVLRYDDDDPYLVVAADKGTATFSDIANGLAEDHGFWLGDAFASGGSQGYDHKKMGITARGAWEAVKRHFREMDRDIQTAPFTCIGVGDMSGDVFGNGMQLSKQTRLLAAFDHRHIFFDPDPDVAKTWAERKRLFDLPRSSWDDFDKSLISKGGGVFPRSAKEIPLNDALKALTGLKADNARPADIIKALLIAPIDLLFFGGIGTYIKAQGQAQADAGDRANDALRVNGRDIRALVVGEGANLGCTQLGRVEYAQWGGPDRKGGRINTDAIDNSAGVDTSDHEVNLKILMSGPLRRGELTADGRNELLITMTEEIAALVLKDNYDQTEVLSVTESRASRDLDAAQRFIRELEKAGKLDREVEQLPDDDGLQARARAGTGLTRPELAVLLAYAKLDLFEEIVDSTLPDDAYLQRELVSYFPPEAVKRFPAELQKHRLHREIVATQLANKLLNIAGPLFVQRLRELSSAPSWRIARAFVIAEGAFALEALKGKIDALDLKIPAARQIAMMAKLEDLLRRLGLWFVVNLPANSDIGGCVTIYAEGANRLKAQFGQFASPFEKEEAEKVFAQFQSDGVPEDLAHELASIPFLAAVPEIVMLAQSKKRDVEVAAAAYAAMGGELGLDRLRGYAAKIGIADYWDRMALRRIFDDFYAGQRILAGGALDSAEASMDGAAAATAWIESHRDDVERLRAFLDELEKGEGPSLAKLSLANSHIQKLAEAAKS